MIDLPIKMLFNMVNQLEKYLTKFITAICDIEIILMIY